MLYACDAPCLAERYRVAAAGVYVGLRLCRIGLPQRAPAAAAATLPAATPCYFWPAVVVSEFINLSRRRAMLITTTTSLVECYRNHIITRISIQTAGLAFGGTGLCSYRVRGVDGSCAEHSTIESYTVFICNSHTYHYLVTTHSLFHSRLKTFIFRKSFPLQPFISS